MPYNNVNTNSLPPAPERPPNVSEVSARFNMLGGWNLAAFGSAILALGIIIFFIVLAIPNSFRSESVEFEIKKGASLREIARDLKNADLIGSTLLFESGARLLRVSQKIQSGVYTFSSDMSILELISALSAKPSPNELTITILEGWTVKDIAKYFENKGIATDTDFLRATEDDYSEEFLFLKDLPKKRANFSYLEGYLFPDTYRVYKTALPKDIIRIMLKNFNAKLLRHMRNEITLQRKTLHDVIIMASLIEREVRTPEDKALVSGILWKRLKLGIGLQTDAAIVYVKTDGRSRTSVDKVYLDDLKIDSPYNTYKNLGLPPAPIANPGIESVEAAIYPKSSSYFYYLSAPDGTTIFSKTLEEHNLNKARTYIKKPNAQKVLNKNLSTSWRSFCLLAGITSQPMSLHRHRFCSHSCA